jgi:hypothetical protein
MHNEDLWKQGMLLPRVPLRLRLYGGAFNDLEHGLRATSTKCLVARAYVLIGFSSASSPCMFPNSPQTPSIRTRIKTTALGLILISPARSGLGSWVLGHVESEP